VNEDEIDRVVAHAHYMDAWFGRHEPGWFRQYCRDTGYTEEFDKPSPSPDKPEKNSRFN
jgi:hypothetical protein